jgi:large subunit ribosomal protein L20
MSRVKRGNVARNRRKKVLKLAKGFRGASSKLFRPAHQAVLNALTHAYKDRRLKKRDFRGLWIARINAALDVLGVSYSKFTGALKKKNILINRKVLSELAIQEPAVFQHIVEATR